MSTPSDPPLPGVRFPSPLTDGRDNGQSLWKVNNTDEPWKIKILDPE